ncbi:alpha/beta hydrolase family esterase [Nocardia terpenica]|nr:PHB depolymerase family esterase [Nocardia terpenica]
MRWRRRDLVVTEGVLDYRQRRSYTVVRPRVVRVGAPLVVVLHGLRDTFGSTRRWMGGTFDRFAEGGGVVVYPDGVDREWNSARRAVMFSRRVKSVDDVGFLRALSERLVAEWALDPRRVFAVGFSLGGQMAIRMVCDAPDVFAGVALISATLPAPGNRVCSDRPPIPVPVLAFHGTADSLAPWAGGTVGFRVSPRQRRAWFGKGPHESVPDTLEWFAARNGIEAVPTVEWVRTGSGWAARTDYRQDGCPPVTGYTIVGGGHEIPGPRWRRLLPDTTVGGGLVAADVIARFFDLDGSE